MWVLGIELGVLEEQYVLLSYLSNTIIIVI